MHQDVFQRACPTQFAKDDGHVRLGDQTVFEIIGKARGCFGAEGDDESARDISVQAMHQSHIGISGLPLADVLADKTQLVIGYLIFFSGIGLGQYAGRLVSRNEVLVFKEDMKEAGRGQS